MDTRIREVLKCSYEALESGDIIKVSSEITNRAYAIRYHVLKVLIYGQ